jgi:hypothetical protein
MNVPRPLFPDSKPLDIYIINYDRLCDPVVRVPGYRSRGLGSIPGSTRFYEK